MKKAWWQRKIAWRWLSWETDLQVAVTGALAAWTVAALPTLWPRAVGVALLLIVALGAGLVRGGPGERAARSLRATTAFSALALACLYLGRAWAGTLNEAGPHATPWRFIPATFWLVVHLVVLAGCYAWADRNGPRSLTRGLPWVAASALLFAS
jgi:hypothetical protein